MDWFIEPVKQYAFFPCSVCSVSVASLQSLLARRRRGPPPAQLLQVTASEHLFIFTVVPEIPKAMLRTRSSNNGTDSCRCRYALAQNGNLLSFPLCFPVTVLGPLNAPSRFVGFIWCPRRAGAALVANFRSYLFTYLLFSGFQRGDYEEEYLLGCDAVYSGRSLPTFWRNTVPPPSGCKRNPNKQQADPDDGWNMFLQNVCKLVLN
jgi:hypothetical protein